MAPILSSRDCKPEPGTVSIHDSGLLGAGITLSTYFSIRDRPVSTRRMIHVADAQCLARHSQEIGRPRRSHAAAATPEPAVRSSRSLKSKGLARREEEVEALRR